MCSKNFAVNVVSGDENDDSVMNDAAQVIRVEAAVADINKLSAALHADGDGLLLADSVGALYAYSDNAGFYNSMQTTPCQFCSVDFTTTKLAM